MNLLCERYRYDYGPHGWTGPADFPVQIRCRVTGGNPPIARVLPTLARRIGIDRSPIDLTDPQDARWLEACVWPDTGRLERTKAAISLAQQDPPTIRMGDANELISAVLADVVATTGEDTVPVVVTTWAFAYLTIPDRRRFVDSLDVASRSFTIAWLSAEGAGTVEGLDQASPDNLRSDGMEVNVLGAMIFDHGARHARVLGFVHQHGNWIDWRAH